MASLTESLFMPSSSKSYTVLSLALSLSVLKWFQYLGNQVANARNNISILSSAPTVRYARPAYYGTFTPVYLCELVMLKFV